MPAEEVKPQRVARRAALQLQEIGRFLPMQSLSLEAFYSVQLIL